MGWMFSNSSLVLAIIAVGGLTYLGTVAFDPTHPTPRLVAGYVCGWALTLIGAGGLLFAAQFELPLLLQGLYVTDAIHMEWLAIGILALFVGAVIVRQAYRRR